MVNTTPSIPRFCTTLSVQTENFLHDSQCKHTLYIHHQVFRTTHSKGVTFLGAFVYGPLPEASGGVFAVAGFWFF